VDIPITLSLDSDGFLRRECPQCEQQFKWHHGPANEEAEAYTDPPTYYCPLCGEPAGQGSWWTQEQLEYAHGVTTPAALRFIQDELAAAFRGNENIKVIPGNDGDIPDVPATLTELDDMRIAASPCHPHEPVKVPEGSSGPYHCLLCGTAFAGLSTWNRRPRRPHGLHWHADALTAAVGPCAGTA